MNMKNAQYKNLGLSVLLILTVSAASFSQDSQKIRPISFYIGIQPAVTVEPFDEYRNTIDVNIFPLIFEYEIDNKWSIRLIPIANLQLRPEFPAAISHLGAGLTVPYHFSKKNSEEGHRGFYAGPHVAVTNHKLDQFNSITAAGEIGFAFLFNSVLSVHVGAQAGTTLMLNPDTGYNVMVRHVGAIFSFGFWF